MRMCYRCIHTCILYSKCIYTYAHAHTHSVLARTNEMNNQQTLILRTASTALFEKLQVREVDQTSYPGISTGASLHQAKLSAPDAPANNTLCNKGFHTHTHTRPSPLCVPSSGVAPDRSPHDPMQGRTTWGCIRNSSSGPLQ